jgi:hypothetical protein
MSKRTPALMMAALISAAAASFLNAQPPTPPSVPGGPWRTGVAVYCPGPDHKVIPANTIISGPNVTEADLCGTGSSPSSAPGAMISNTGNFMQDTVTNGVNLAIISNTRNPIVSSFMQGAATSFISALFANDDAEAQRQQEAMAQEILRRKQELERQQRIARQQRLDAMFARLNQALKLEGVPFGLSLKPMDTGSGLQLKAMNSSGPDALKLKMGEGYGIPGLPGIYVGGPAGGQTVDNGSSTGTESKGYGIQGLPGIYVGGPAGGQAGDTSANSGGMPGLPGIYLNGVQPSQAPQLAQAAQTLNGPDRALAGDTALQAAQQNPALTAPSQDPRVENFQQANQDYQQALQANAAATVSYQTAQGHVEADQSAISVAQNQIRSITPSVQQQQAFNQMLAAAKTDEEAATIARQGFDSTEIHLSASRDHAVAALAAFSPAPSGSPVVGLQPNAVVANLKTPDRSGTPIFMPSPASAPPPPPAERQYRPSGNGFVGGTGWIIGYNVPNPTPQLIAKARAMLAEQEKLTNASRGDPSTLHPYSDAVDFQHYNFVIGIAEYADFGWDLLFRVVPHDEFTEGRYSIENMPGYASLTGRSFTELACHSNGAMVCLAALEKKDVKAENVVLYGPQITQQALEQWDGLVRSGQVKSVTLVINSGDPVPPLSLGFEDYVQSHGQLLHETYATKPLLLTQGLTSAINETAPRLLVHVYDCPLNLLEPLHCHGMDTYRSEGAH